jgi:hypothetical protein
MGSCETNETSKGTKVKGETAIPLSENQPIADTLHTSNSKGDAWCRQVVAEGKATVNAGKAFLDTCTCNMEEKYLQKAKQLCDCVNNIGQVSVMCDSLSVAIDKRFSADEKLIIQNILENLNCME